MYIISSKGIEVKILGEYKSNLTRAASKFWANSIKEYYCVDISKDMHEVSEYLMKRAIPQVKPIHIFYRQFFPASPIVRI